MVCKKKKKRRSYDLVIPLKKISPKPPWVAPPNPSDGYSPIGILWHAPNLNLFCSFVTPLRNCDTFEILNSHVMAACHVMSGNYLDMGHIMEPWIRFTQKGWVGFSWICKMLTLKQLKKVGKGCWSKTLETTWAWMLAERLRSRG